MDKNLLNKWKTLYLLTTKTYQYLLIMRRIDNGSDYYKNDYNH